MTTERRTDESLDRFASTVAAAIIANNEQIAANSSQLMRIGQLVESNNRFLEALGQDLRRYSDNMDRLTTICYQSKSGRDRPSLKHRFMT
jgi:hypothetical protein